MEEAVLLILVVAIMMASPSTASMLSTCSSICAEEKHDDLAQCYGGDCTMCYGGDCLYLSEDYDRFSAPNMSADTSLPHQVELVTTIFSISNIDIDEGMFEVEIWLQLSWQDNRMRACQCQDRGNRKVLQLSGDLDKFIWIPDLDMLNLLEMEYEVDSSSMGGIKVVSHEHSAGVLYDIRLDAVISCHFVASWFPFDNNICLLMIGVGHPASEMLISMHEQPHLKMNYSSGYSISIQRLPVLKTKQQFTVSRYSTKGEFQSIGFGIGFKRDDHSIMDEYTAIIGVMIIMSTLSLVLPHSDRLGPIGIILLGALTVYYTASIEFPRPAGSFSPLIVYVLSGGVICCLSLLQFAILLRLKTHTGSRVGDKLDTIFLVLGILAWPVTTVLVWVVGRSMAGNCVNGDDECYHNWDHWFQQE